MDFRLIGKKIKEIRKQNNFTQQKLSEALNINEKYVSNLEVGKDSCSLSLLLSTANLFNVSIDYLLSDNLKYNLLVNKDKTEEYVKLQSCINILNNKEISHLIKFIELMKQIENT